MKLKPAWFPAVFGLLLIFLLAMQSVSLAQNNETPSLDMENDLIFQEDSNDGDKDAIEELLKTYLPQYAQDHGWQGLTINGLTIEGDRAYVVAQIEGSSVNLSPQELKYAREAVGEDGIPENVVGFILEKDKINSWTIISDNDQTVASEINIPVPFTPQVPPGDWNNTKSCGQTSSAMIYAFYGFYGHSPANAQDIVAINSWLAQEYNDNRYLDENGYYTSTSMLSNLARNYAGYGNTYYGSNWTLNQLKQEILAGRPVIIAVYTNMATSGGYKHFMVLRGLRLDDNGNITHVIVNDPGRSLASGHGENYVYSVATFENSWVRNSKAVVVIVSGGTPPSTCAAPSNGNPRDNTPLNNNQVTFSWTPPNCNGLDYYTLRVSNHADIDNPPWIIDHGVDANASSTTETIPSEYDGQTLYWAIWPHNNSGYGSRGGPWTFKIDTSAPPPPPPLPTGTWDVKYFLEKELNTQCSTTTFERTFIFQDWGESAPAGGCNSDNWGARFTRQVAFQGGDYTFAIEADDWGRIYVDGNLVVNKWDGASQHYEGYHVNAGTHEVRVEFADTAGAAKISAWWWGPGFSVPHDTQDPNQWYANYWLNQTQWWDAYASVNEGTGILSHDWGYNSPGWDMPVDNFSAKFSRTAYFECGNYRFTISHDDGAKFWLDGVLKVDRWSGPIGYYEFTLPVSRGTHALQVDMYENGGAANIYFDWQQISSCAPSAPALQYPANSSSLAWNTDLTFQWNPVSGATQYYVQLQGGPDVNISSDWISGTQWYVGGLWPGVYTWKVTSRNENGSSSPSSTWTFTIQDQPIEPPTDHQVFLPAILRINNSVGQWDTMLYEGFESIFPGNWVIYDLGNDGAGIGYQWKDRNCLSSAGYWSGWAIGGGANGGTLSCGSDYPNNATTWMVYGPLNLSDATSAELLFDLWLNTEEGYDFIRWGASDNGYSFTMESEDGNTYGWVPRSLNLADVNGTSYLGKPEVWIAFLFTSDGSVTYPNGAVIDEVLLRKCVGGICQ